jgi:hypothetical protein
MKVSFTLGLTAGILIAGTTTAIAADAVRASLFPIQVFINQKTQVMPAESPIVNYNNQTYVPLRFFSERLGQQVVFEQGPTDEQSTVTINSSDINSTDKGWRMDQLMYPGNHRDSPLSLMLNMKELTPIKNTPLDERHYQFGASIYNVSEQAILLLSGFKIDLEIIKADGDGFGEVVWEGSITHSPFQEPANHFDGLLLPGTNKKIIWGFQSPLWRWDGKDSRGVPLPPGKYFLRQRDGAQLQYQIMETLSSDIRTHKFNRSMANGIYGFAIRASD